MLTNTSARTETGTVPWNFLPPLHAARQGGQQLKQGVTEPSRCGWRNCGTGIFNLVHLHSESGRGWCVRRWAAVGPVHQARLLSLLQTKKGTYSHHSTYTNDNRPGSQGSEHHEGNGHIHLSLRHPPRGLAGGKGERREARSMPVWSPAGPSQRRALLKGDTGLYFLF